MLAESGEIVRNPSRGIRGLTTSNDSMNVNSNQNIKPSSVIIYLLYYINII